ncbi:aminopeptidase N isoform X2 [Aphidius gifuensis]|uniref:aminopeptidase N isoform X2 n=1 Tax=Aphidius gifuensis TaxID=684658 RepID=UPI001CDB8FA1|nr:aminopeptidase N isoform X2 [Aphidius gifuensis]
MRQIASFAFYIALFVILQIILADNRTKSKRSIDFNDVLKLPAYRMPRDLKPLNYQLEIRPSTKDAIFKARVKIDALWSIEGSRIKLDAHSDLHITEVDIKCLTNNTDTWENATIAGLEHNTKKSEYNIDLQQWYTVGRKCQLNINFTGNISTSETSGIFMNSYLDTLVQAHVFVATHLRLNNARKLFPCIDEPEYKATFDLSIIRPRTMIARANTPIKITTDVPNDPNYLMDIFEKTPEMSTYQLAFMISDFESLSPTRTVNRIEGRNPLDIKVWGRKEYLTTLSKVPNKIVTIINYLQNYFNISIGISKIDLVAMPMYTATKASDNWGLMFFRESELSSPLVWNTAYELIYQWIGQRVTPFRWSDAQVNKALNSFLASKTTVDIDPNEMEGKWPMTLLYSLYYEFGKTFPFSRVAGIRHEAASAKTELIFRMFNYTMSEELFRKGVQKLLHESATNRSFYANDIFMHLDTVRLENNLTLPSDLTISNIAAPWINRDRVPLVTVTRNYETGNINFTQNVYLREPAPPSNEKMSYSWDIPIVMISENTLNLTQLYPTFWMTKSDLFVTIETDIDNNEFIIVNPEEIGMFPVNYDMCNWAMISEFLQGPKRESIPVLTRAKLLHDAWNMAYAGNFCFDIALNMTLFLKNETSHVVWEPFFTMIDHVGRRIQGSGSVSAKFEAYVFSLLEPLYKNQLGEVPQINEPSWKIHMRGLVKNFLCRAGYLPCVKEAEEQYRKWMKDDEPDEGNPVANEFICPVFRWGTMEEWEFGLQRVINFPQKTLERKQSERTYLLKTLAGCPVDKIKIEKLLNITILSQNTNFTDSDIHLVYSTLTGSAAGYSTLFDFLVDNWDTVKQKFENKKHLWNGIVNSATSSFSTQEGYDMVSELYANKQGEFDSADSLMEKVLDDIDQESKWSEKNIPVIDSWLQKNVKIKPTMLMSFSRQITTVKPII